MKHRFPFALWVVVGVVLGVVPVAGVAPADQTLLDAPTQTATPLRPLPKQPLPIFDECGCTGTVFVLGPGGVVTPVTRTYPITGPTVDTAPRDTCPSGSRLDVRWHAEPRPAMR